MKKTLYILPDNSLTTDLKKYLRQWKAIANPIAKEFDLEVGGFDPNIGFMRKERTDFLRLKQNYVWSCFTMHKWLAVRILRLIQERNKLRKGVKALTASVEKWQKKRNNGRHKASR
jgi:hypothetical protein